MMSARAHRVAARAARGLPAPRGPAEPRPARGQDPEEWGPEEAKFFAGERAALLGRFHMPEKGVDWINGMLNRRGLGDSGENDLSADPQVVVTEYAMHQQQRWWQGDELEYRFWWGLPEDARDEYIDTEVDAHMTIEMAQTAAREFLARSRLTDAAAAGTYFRVEVMGWEDEVLLTSDTWLMSDNDIMRDQVKEWIENMEDALRKGLYDAADGFGYGHKDPNDGSWSGYGPEVERGPDDWSWVVNGMVHDRAPRGIRVVIMTDPRSAGGKRKALDVAPGARKKPKVRYAFVRFGLEAFRRNPAKFKGIQDCGQTGGPTGPEKDCVLKCLAYGHLLKNGRHVQGGEAKFQFDVRSAENVNLGKNGSNYLGTQLKRSMARGRKPSKLVRDVDLMRTLLCKTWPEAVSRNREVRVAILDALCTNVEGGIGYRSRVRVWEPQADGAVIIHTTADRRSEAITNLQHAALRETAEERAERVKKARDQGIADADIDEHLVTTMKGVPPEALPVQWYDLLLVDGHCYFVKNPARLVNHDRWCDTCQVGYYNDRTHACKGNCPCCLTKLCDWDGSEVDKTRLQVQCQGFESCHRRFVSTECERMHRQQDRRGKTEQDRRGAEPAVGLSTCDLVWRCNHALCRRGGEMSRNIQAKEDHVHGCTTKCAVCVTYVEDLGKHKCVIKSQLGARLRPDWELWFFDLETFPDKEGMQTCNLAKLCNEDGTEWYTFYNVDDLARFMAKDVGAEGVPDRRYIAHNGAKFDFQPLAIAFLKLFPQYKFSCIKNGAAFVTMGLASMPAAERPTTDKYWTGARNKEAEQAEAKRLRDLDKVDPRQAVGQRISFVDSKSFISGALAGMTETFGLPPELSKGHFPHKFNRRENWNYSGTVPPLEFFEPQRKANTGKSQGDVSSSQDKGDLEKLILWYVDEIWRTTPTRDQEVALYQEEAVLQFWGRRAGLHQNDLIARVRPKFEGPWVFKEELDKYCRMDVELLRQACLKFQTLMREVYTPVNRKNKKIQVWDSKGERLTVLPGQALPRLNVWSYTTIAGYCYDVYLRHFYKHKTLAHFSPEEEQHLRRAFHGGRTETFQIYKRVPLAVQPAVQPLTSEERMDLLNRQPQIRKVDVCSEYPYVNKVGKYTTGRPIEFNSWAEWSQHRGTHSQWYFDNAQCEYKQAPECDMMSLDWVLWNWCLHVDPEKGLDGIGSPHFVNGLCIVELDFEGPKNLRIPVLCAKKQLEKGGAEKLIFSLEPASGEVVNILELWEAAQRGYKLFNVKRITWWPAKQVLQRSADGKQNGLFGAYVDTFLAAKISAGGWPQGLKDGDAPEEVLDMHRQGWFHEIETMNPGTLLDVARMSQTKNTGMYSCAKLVLNTLWGKANQRNNLVQRIYVRPHEYAEYFKYFTDPTLQCKWTDLAPDLAEIQFVKKAADIEIAKNTCITVGVWTTAQGRLLLYRQLARLADDQPLYCDTDSIMYYHDPMRADHARIECTPDKLGAFTDELAKETARGDLCVEFVAGGPKNYGYMTENLFKPRQASRKSEYKVKGHTIKGGHADFRSAKNTLTYTKFKQVILENALLKLRVAPELAAGWLKEALDYAPSQSYFEANPKDRVDEKGQHVEEIKVLYDNVGRAALQLLYHDRFRVDQLKFRVKVGEHKVKYGWSFDKAVLLQQAQAWDISTRPYGHELVANQQ